METIKIQAQNTESKIVIGDSFKNFSKWLPNKRTVVITDNKVMELYGSYFSDYTIIEIGQTETIKKLETVEYIIQQFVNLEIDRSCFVLGVGGGIVCDISGFVASIYMRGVSFGFVSTTLLSQVDASVGGKNGVNFCGLKNMLGVFNLPNFVICDSEMLKTLSKDEFNNGLAEIVKHSLIADEKMFESIEKNTDKILALDTDFIDILVSKSVKIKAEIVNQDVKEKGERKKLNLGHTYGHAIEKTLQIPHGKAVSIGLVIAANISESRGLIKKQDVQRIKNLLKKLNLPVQINEKHKEIADAVTMDKKRNGDKIDFIFLEKIGKASIQSIYIDELKSLSL